jgi:deoxyribose-phosphate aldolase
MTNEELFARIDHTLLKAVSSWEEIKTLCDEAVQFKTATVCVPPSYVSPIHEAYGNKLVICTTVGFPLGYSITAVKALEAEKAVQDGASEIDMVINIGDIKNTNFEKIQEEIKLIKEICGEKILKVIIETCCLTENEKIRMCGIITEADADYIKTSTGFGSAGAVLADMDLFRHYIGAQVRIKASGGIKSREEMIAFITAGADRIGTSNAIKLLGGNL